MFMTVEQACVLVHMYIKLAHSKVFNKKLFALQIVPYKMSQTYIHIVSW